jgi:hypothetical protein
MHAGADFLYIISAKKSVENLAENVPQKYVEKIGIFRGKSFKKSFPQEIPRKIPRKVIFRAEKMYEKSATGRSYRPKIHGVSPS